MKMYTANDLIKLYRMQSKTKTPILYAEEKGEIPHSTLGKRGSISIKQWSTKNLPTIGEKFGFLKKPISQIVMSTYTPKGGVGKSTLTANLARTLAINGIKTLLIGLDFQRSLTRYILPKTRLESIDEIGKDPIYGLHHFLFEKVPLNKVIQKTDLPTLDIIPETSDINFMAKKMRVENRREYIFKEKIIKRLSSYQVILFDCTPGWNDLTENALVAANHVIMPVACEVECYEALKTNLDEIDNFKNDMHLNWETYIKIPTMLEHNTISNNIYASYSNEYKSDLIPLPIRRSITAQEARAACLSIFEYAPKTNLADDYFEIIKAIWGTINNFGEDDE